MTLEIRLPALRLAGRGINVSQYFEPGGGRAIAPDETRRFPALRAVCAVSTQRAAGKTGVAGDGLRMAFTFYTDALPYLQIWHDFRWYACVLVIEPCASAKTNGVEKIMQPARTSRYEVTVCFKSGQ